MRIISLIIVISVSFWGCAGEDEGEVSLPPRAGQMSSMRDLPLAGERVEEGGSQVSGGTEGGVAAQGGAGGGGAATGGTPAGGTPAGGTPAGGTPAGGTPAGGTPVGGEPVGGEPVGGEPVGGEPVGGEPVPPLNLDEPCEGLGEAPSALQLCSRFAECVTSSCPERLNADEAVSLCQGSLEPENSENFCDFSCGELIDITDACEEPAPPAAAFCAELEDPSDPTQACQAMSDCLLTQCPDAAESFPALCTEYAESVCDQEASCEELGGALCP